VQGALPISFTLPFDDAVKLLTGNIRMSLQAGPNGKDVSIKLEEPDLLARKPSRMPRGVDAGDELVVALDPLCAGVGHHRFE
jgi:hypothetical protein